MKTKFVFDRKYLVTSLGAVSRVKKSGELRPICLCSDGKGYLTFTACVAGKRTTVKVHSLVAECFLGPRPSGLQVNHRDGDKANNRIENLEYVTPRENIEHSIKSGLQGKRNARLTASQVLVIRRSQFNPTQLALKFGVSRENIYLIKKGESWKNV